MPANNYDLLAERLVTKAAAVRHIKQALEPISTGALAGAGLGALVGGGTEAVGPKKKKQVASHALMGATAGAGAGAGIGLASSMMQNMPRGRGITSELPAGVQDKLPQIAEQLNNSESVVSSPVEAAAGVLNSYTKAHPILGMIGAADLMSHTLGATSNLTRAHGSNKLPSMRVSDLLEGLDAKLTTEEGKWAPKDSPTDSRKVFYEAKKLFENDREAALAALHRSRTAAMAGAAGTTPIGHGLTLDDVRHATTRSGPFWPKIQPGTVDDVTDLLHSWSGGILGNPATSTGTKFQPATTQNVSTFDSLFHGLTTPGKPLEPERFGLPAVGKMNDYSGSTPQVADMLKEKDSPIAAKLKEFLQGARTRKAVEFQPVIKDYVDHLTSSGSLDPKVDTYVKGLLGNKDLTLRDYSQDATLKQHAPKLVSQIRQKIMDKWLADAQSMITPHSTLPVTVPSAVAGGGAVTPLSTRVLKALSGLELPGRAKSWAGAIAPRAALYGGVPILQSLLGSYMHRTSEQSRLNKLIQDAIPRT